MRTRKLKDWMDQWERRKILFCFILCYFILFYYYYYYYYYYFVFWGKRREKLDEVAWDERDDLWEGIWKQEGEKREEREDWVKVEYNGGATRKEQVE